VSCAQGALTQLKSLEKTAKLFSRPYFSSQTSSQPSVASSSSSSSSYCPPLADVGRGLSVLSAAVKSGRLEVVGAVLECGHHLASLADSDEVRCGAVRSCLRPRTAFRHVPRLLAAPSLRPGRKEPRKEPGKEAGKMAPCVGDGSTACHLPRLLLDSCFCCRL